MRAAPALLSLFAAALPAQGVLDVLDGETLYEGGFLYTVGYEYERGETLRTGSSRAGDPFASNESFQRATVALQYGLRNDLQLGIALPYVWTDRSSTLGEDGESGLGDVHLLAKWRFFRHDGPGVALNCALLGELSLPTGEDDAQDGGVRLEPELQPGSGGIDPALGVGITHEPGRWRFNAAALHRFRTDSDGDDARLGDETVVELAAGNRFWLEPYPGPFMRLDVLARWYHEDHAWLGAELPDTGGDRATAGVNLAFRPRPSLDFQLQLEVPFWQDVNGTQLGDDWSVDFVFGYRF